MFLRQEHSIVSLATRNGLQFDYQRQKKLLLKLVTLRQVSFIKQIDIMPFVKSKKEKR